MERFHPIGVPGEPWTDAERRAWFATRTVQRSFSDDVVRRIEKLDPSITVTSYGALPIDPERYPLLSATARSTTPDHPWVLVTGGVHGYETSGVHGALAFLEGPALDYRDRLNIVVVPCVSPWGYEVIDRWNPDAVDPNRSFVPNSPAPESGLLMQMLAGLPVEFLVHVDLHETTDTDESEFRPALAARDGVEYEPGLIPDGFYTVGDTENPQPGFQAAIIAGAESVTHIADADGDGRIIETPVTQRGVIEYPLRDLGLCAGVTGARFTTTTEVYPDSPSATPQICVDAQVAALCGGLDFALSTVATSD